MEKFKLIIQSIKKLFHNNEIIPLHEPFFNGNEKKYLNECIDSTFVSSVGKFVTSFENKISNYTNTNHGIAVVNGTSALSIALKAVGVDNNDEVITQALTFVATANAIHYNSAHPVFIDVDVDTMGLSPNSLLNFLSNNAEVKNGNCFNIKTKRKISACLPMHTFGFPVRIEEIVEICKKWCIPVVEDAAESLGSFVNGKSVGSFGDIGVFSFNGNKIITSGGGGAIVTNNEKIAKWLKHVTTTAKKAHPYNYYHDEIGFNYRMPNLNAALLLAQMEQLDSFIDKKRNTAHNYKSIFQELEIDFKWELENTRVNFWLICMELNNRKERDDFLDYAHSNGVLARPMWELMIDLPMYKHCQHDDQKNARFLSDRIVNLPSSVI